MPNDDVMVMHSSHSDSFLSSIISALLYDSLATISRNTLFWHFPHYWWGTKVTPYSIVRGGNWKLIRWYENGSTELYNLDEDISESINLVESYPSKTNELNKKLDGWLSEVNAKIPIQVESISADK